MLRSLLVLAGSLACCIFPGWAATDVCSGSALLQHKSTVSSSKDIPEPEDIKAPCSCVADNAAWLRSARTTPKCVFIDLGAADGNTFQEFLQNRFVDVATCPHGEWHAVLVEANPLFKGALDQHAIQHPGKVEPVLSAAYMCEGRTSFFLDSNEVYNHCGSSMSPIHGAVRISTGEEVVVDTINLNKYLIENTIPEDVVIVKMDIEGAEWDILPCLSESPAASLIDTLFMEVHEAAWGLQGTTPLQMEHSKELLVSRGVAVPDYFSWTF
mmetsp:Transcript_57572/g.136922  ORF Transcript_57572/g.136922 Transcript_57572/m.136922 type:complete len:269 (-) Transcript_57572:49-855(-)